MAVRLIAMDLDDTLLRDDFTISPRVVEAVRRVRKQGVVTTIATGRTPAATRPYAEQLQLDVPVITFHGALIRQALSGEVLFRRTLSPALAGEIVDDVLKKDMHVQLYCRERILVQEKNEWSQEYARISKVAIEQADLRQFLAAEGEGVEKLLIIAAEEDLDALAPSLRERYGRRAQIVKSKPIFLELTDIAVNKGVALAALAERFGIAQAEVMAIGDSFNDLDMLRYAGLGVAMGNARPEVKKEADAVTSSNQEDGVAEAIEKYVLRQETGDSDILNA